MENKRKTFEEIKNGSLEDEIIIDWIQDATIEELQALLKWAHHGRRIYAVASSMLAIRLSEAERQPHWSLTPTFWVSVAVLIVAILAWIFPRSNDKPPIPIVAIPPATASFQAPQSNSPVVTPATNKISLPATSSVPLIQAVSSNKP
jgi:hypothetical protein